jgi:hypothetical protein
LLFWQAFPTKTNKEIRDLIIQSSDKYAAPTAQYGYGIPNFSLALTRSVKDFDKIILFLIQIQLHYFGPVSRKF